MMQPPTKELLKWPLVQQLYTRVPVSNWVAEGTSPLAPLYKDARLVNAYAERVPESRDDYWIFKRLGVGLKTFSTGGVPAGQYFYEATVSGNSYTGFLYVVNGVLYDTGTSIGTIVSSSNYQALPVFFEFVGPADVVIITGMPGVGWGYNVTTKVLTQITDTTFTAINQVPGLAYLDEWFFVMDNTGTIWNTQNLNNVVVWNAANTIKASSRSDQGVYLGTQLNYVIAMKQWSTQIFYDATAQVSGLGSPLGPVPDAQIPYGCFSGYSVQKIDEILFWVTSNQTISPQIIMMQNLQATIVSSPSIDRILDNLSGLLGTMPLSSPLLYSWVLKHGGHRFYGLTIQALNVTLVFDIDEKLWYLWTDANGNYWPFSFPYYVPPQAIGSLIAGGNITGVHIFQCINSVSTELTAGYSYQVDGDYEFPTDNGLIFPVDIYTPVTDFGTLRTKQLNMMYFDTDINKGNMMLARYTDDDYNTWSNFRQINLAIDRPELDDEGSFVRRAYHFRHALPCPFRIRSSGLDMDVGIL